MFCVSRETIGLECVFVVMWNIEMVKAEQVC